MKNGAEMQVESICRKLQIEDYRFVEIEAKKRILPEDVKDIQKFLLKRRKVIHQKAAFFFDQFLDTPGMDLFRRGASMRLRYKRNGANVYLQYKGPGFKSRGVLFRSEFSTERLQHVLMEESHHDIVHFSNTSVREILAEHAEPGMARALEGHLGSGIIARITQCNILCIYQKDKFLVETGSAFLEPSLDRVYAFHIQGGGLRPLSTFCEYENEIKSSGGDLEAKLDHIDDLVEFDQELAERFDMRPEPLDKYHRCASFFIPKKKKRR